MYKKLTIIAVAALGCASSKNTTGPAPNQESGESLIDSNTVAIPTRSVIIDWANRNLDVPPVPGWLKAAVLGNTNQFRQEYGLGPDRVLKLHQTEAAGRNQAMTIVQVTYAARVANQLKQAVLTRAGVSLQGDEFETVNNAVTEAKVTLTGLEQAADFWQLIETEDTRTGQKQQRYVYYIMYSIEGRIWDAIVAKYLQEVVGKIPDTKGQQIIGEMFAELKEDTKREQAMSEEQFKAQLQAQRDAADRAHQLELAKTNQQTAVQLKEQQTAQVQAAANSQAQQAAYRSGDPVQAARPARAYPPL
jgi:hypothetical protein